MKNILAGTLALVGVFSVGILALNVAAMPDVHFSYSTGECVNVVNYTDEVFTCENYPNKFHHVWVQ